MGEADGQIAQRSCGQIMHLDYDDLVIQPAVAFMYNAMHDLPAVKPDYVSGQYVPGGYYTQPTTGELAPLNRQYPAETNRSMQQATCAAQYGPNYQVGPTGIAQDCDEYPFLATKQNVFQNPAPPGQTWAVYPVARAANQMVGSDLSSYFGDDRVLAGDAFYVALDNVPPDCCSHYTAQP